MQVKGKKVTVLGAARSGISAALLLANQEARVFVSEKNKDLETADLLTIFRENRISWEFGAHSDAVFTADFVIVSPGIPSDAPVLRAFAERDIPVYSEIEAASWFSESPVIAVTGSNGKTTTTALIADMLTRSGIPAVACGNIGHSFSKAVYTAILSGSTHPMYVAEVSSFQLENIRDFHPNVAVLLNISPDHLDRYDSFLEYALMKCRILINQSKKDFAVLNRDDAVIKEHARTRAFVIPVSRNKQPDSVAYFDGERFLFKAGGDWQELPRDEIKLFGIHNEYNIASAASAVSPYVDEHDGVFESLRRFTAIPHRIEFVGESGNIRFYNDSKGTNIDAVIMAIRSFNSPLHLILGGRDKNNDFAALRPFLDNNDHIYVIGEAAPKIMKVLKDLSPQFCGDLETAVTKAFRAASSGDAVLLSPACASYDQYKNFEERGEHFKEIVRDITGAVNAS